MSWDGWTTRSEASIDYWEKIASAHVPPECRTSIMCAVAAGMHAAEHFDGIEAETSRVAVLEVVPYAGSLKHPMPCDFRILVDMASIQIGTKLYAYPDLKVRGAA